MQRVLFLLLTLLAGVSAQEIGTTGNVEASHQEMETVAETTHPETGTASAASAEAATQRSNWQNWVFAGSALITVTAGVVIISLNSGTSH